jgi:UDP-N-acetylmuramyl pentapeptide phosphotransferase/UDP-N-acetylglucosamine-1-phosphate transferase
MRGVGRAALMVAGGVAARAALRRVVQARGAEALARTNYHGRPVTLAAGPALAVAASATAAAGAALGPAGLPAAAAALAAGLGSGAVGLYDDVAGARPGGQAKGFRGHLGALRHGRVTSGLIKIVGVGAAGLSAAALLPSRPDRSGALRTADVLLGAGVIAGTANLVNLLDLRPGRAVKAGLLIGAPLLNGPAGTVVAGPVGAAAALLPDDLGERTMLGDAGANALGAVLGVALAARTGLLGRSALLAGIAGLTAASERVSFTEVIARTPGLRELDALGRRRPRSRPTASVRPRRRSDGAGEAGASGGA